MGKERVTIIGTLLVALVGYAQGQTNNIVTVDTVRENPNPADVKDKVRGFWFTTTNAFDNVTIKAKLRGTGSIQVLLQQTTPDLTLAKTITTATLTLKTTTYFREWVSLFENIPHLAAGTYVVRFWAVPNKPSDSSIAVDYVPVITPNQATRPGSGVASQAGVGSADTIYLDPLPSNSLYLFEVKGDLPVPVTPVSIIAKHSGKCLDVSGGAIGQGTLLQQYQCNGLPQQRFWITRVGTSSSEYKIISFNGQVLDVRDGSSANGAPIQTWSFLGGSNQKWRFVATGPGEFKVRSVSSSKLLAVGSGPSYTSNTALVQLWDDTGLDNQRFQLVANPEAFPAGVVRMVSKASKRCLDIPSGNIADGVLPQVWDCNGNPQQRFWLTKTISGDYLIMTDNGKVLDVRGMGTTSGTPIQQWLYWGGTNQRWYLTATGTNEYIIKGLGSGLMLHVLGFSALAFNGTPLQILDSSWFGNETWTLQYVK
ncbi:MAG: RICIN domain-containing protein [Bryobacterales bacterium]|nr:RICIN domain-containing protein [Bryobacterales bacterium]